MTMRQVRPARGFTLVELLVVITIIIILVGILVPAVGAIRRNARNVQTRSILGTLGTALESYKSEARLGSVYPPSASDIVAGGTVGSFAVGEIANPYRSRAATGAPDRIRITGAGLLVLALLGPDTRGCAGFKTFRTVSQFWAQDSGADPVSGTATPGNSGAYATRSDTDETPVYQRAAAYIDPSKLRQSRSQPGGTPNFVIDAEDNGPVRNYPMFLDAFGGPVLYWRADPGGAKIADRAPPIAAADLPNRGIYHYSDNAPLLDPDDPIAAGADGLLRTAPASEPQRLQWDPAGGGTLPTPLLTGATSQYINQLDQGAFAGYIRDQNVQAQLAPARRDYILASAGSDGIFGTADDITNFETTTK